MYTHPAKIYRSASMNKHATMMRLAELELKVASMEYTAGLKDNLKSLLLRFISKPSKELQSKQTLLTAPLDDLADDLIEVLAPKIAEALQEEEINADYSEFEQGANLRNSEKSLGGDGGYFPPMDPPSGMTPEFYEGYEWGDVHQTPIPPAMKRKIIEDAAREHDKKVAERLVADTLKTSWGAINPINIFKHLFHAVKKYAWDADAHRVWYQKWPLRILKLVLIGVGYALVEVFEHYVIPKALVALTGNTALYAVGALPLFEMFAPIVAIFFRKAGEEVTEEKDNPLKWYESNFGEIENALPDDNLFEGDMSKSASHRPRFKRHYSY